MSYLSLLSALALMGLAVVVGCADDADRAARPAADSGLTSDAGPAGPVRILPLGDSLTLGFGSATEGAGTEGGYRVRLAELLAAAGVDFDFVGSQSHGPASLADKDHEGYNGYSVAQVGEMAGPALAAYDPAIVLLLAGTNDQITFVPPSQPPAGAAEDMEALLEQLHSASPAIRIIVAKVIPLSFNAEGVEEFNALLDPLVERQRERGVHVELVDMYAIGTELLSADGIHPTQEGYDRMAEIWYPAIMSALSSR